LISSCFQEGNSPSYTEAIDELVGEGVVVVVAAGNDADDACYYSPAFVPSAITVGSTTQSDQVSWFSNYGTCLDIYAPGSNVISVATGSGDGYV
jgi:subtilisin family serine protease